MPSKIVRTIDAASDEVIRIRWWRVRLTDSDPPERITEILTEEYTVPPTPVWEARQTSDKEATHG